MLEETKVAEQTVNAQIEVFVSEYQSYARKSALSVLVLAKTVLNARNTLKAVRESDYVLFREDPRVDLTRVNPSFSHEQSGRRTSGVFGKLISERLPGTVARANELTHATSAPPPSCRLWLVPYRLKRTDCVCPRYGFLSRRARSGCQESRRWRPGWCPS